MINGFRIKNVMISKRIEGVFWKRGSFQKVHLLEILENLESLEILENPQTLEIKKNLTIF